MKIGVENQWHKCSEIGKNINKLKRPSGSLKVFFCLNNLESASSIFSFSNSCYLIGIDILAVAIGIIYHLTFYDKA